MTKLTEFVRARIAERGWQQKQLAHEWHGKVGEGGVVTYETRLSKVLNDDDEGYDFLLAEGTNRLRGLASALGSDPEELRALCEVARARLTLVLHPALPEVQRAFFRARAGEVFGVEELAESDRARPREPLRDVAKRSRNPIVVLPDDRDLAFFDGAGLRTSRVQGEHGWLRLTTAPDLIPRRPALLHDADGMPMIPAAEEEARYRELIDRLEASRARRRQFPHMLDSQHDRLEWDAKSASAWIDRIHEADAQGEPVTFRLDLLEQRPWPVVVTQRILEKATGRTRSASYSKQREKEPPMDIWFHNGRIFALCPADEPRRARIAAYHAVHDVSTFEPLVDSVRLLCAGINTTRRDGEIVLPDEARAFEAETGIAISADREMYLNAMAGEWSNTEAWDAQKAVRVSRSAEADAQVREVLTELLDRDFQLLGECEGVPFSLEAARDAPLMHGVDRNAPWLVIANLGAGRLLRLTIHRFPAEQPSPVRCFRRSRLSFTCDGRDVRVIADGILDENLKGNVHRSVRRRRDKEARNALDDD